LASENSDAQVPDLLLTEPIETRFLFTVGEVANTGRYLLIKVKSGDELFEEHFPGNPMLPASLLLEFVWKLLTRLTHGHLDDDVRFDRVRLARPIVPGGNYFFERHHFARESRSTMFSLREMDGSVVARGNLNYSRSEPHRPVTYF
jgi:3-hydroxymyristoyl/3-hydroxydecanoyl-(acyl carrier protein) dehydratase